MSLGFLSPQLLLIGTFAAFTAGCGAGPNMADPPGPHYLDLSGQFDVQLRYTDHHTDHGTLMFTQSDPDRGVYVGWMALEGYPWSWDVFAVVEGAQLRVNLRERLYIRQTAGLTRSFSFIVMSKDELYSRVRMATCPGPVGMFRNSSRTAPGLCNPILGHLAAKRVADVLEERPGANAAAAVTPSRTGPATAN